MDKKVDKEIDMMHSLYPVGSDAIPDEKYGLGLKVKAKEEQEDSPYPDIDEVAKLSV